MPAIKAEEAEPFMSGQSYPALGLIVALPLVGTLINLLVGHRLPRRLVHWIACGAIGFSFLVALLAFFDLLALGHGGEGTTSPALTYALYPWFESGRLAVRVGFSFDRLAAVMCLVVTSVSFLIHVYSVGYMAGDRSYSRYFTYLNFFCFAMLLLVLADSLVVLFIGWEGVGLASYLLIGFWFEDPAKAMAGQKAFIVNRIGDAGFLLGLFLLFTFTQSLEIPAIREWVVAGGAGGELYRMMPVPFGVAVGILLFVGCVGKSAQLPLYVWLPDAMAGPTPVSALIHAATMVTAGVYLVARMGFLYLAYPGALAVVAVVGLLTALVAATIAICQTDIKKILAYSTISQLGYMFLALGVGAFSAGIFHLMTHAFFKALLFLGAGAVIHALDGEQEISAMGGLHAKLKLVSITFLVACLAISGVPLFSGFFSKDEILWGTLNGSMLAPWGQGILWGVGLITAGLTAFYMFRLYFMTFAGRYRGQRVDLAHLHRPPLSMSVPLVALAVLAAVGGFVGVPEILGGANRFHHWLSEVLPGQPERLSHLWEGLSMAASVLVALAGIGLAWQMYWRRIDLPARLADRARGLYRWVSNRYYVDEAYEAAVVRPLRSTSQLFYSLVDRLLIDTFLVHGVAFAARVTGLVAKKLQNGDVQRYGLFVLLGLGATLFLLFLG
ncbi:MAG: NADH-quinone oxidoreductase subunit L [Bradymonadales bacterium]|nr:NADH-quinone oxidoreductase subunit L [Bradymonadales bacterium]